MDPERTRNAGSFVFRLMADYKLACFARALLESRSVSAAVGREE